MENNEIVKAIRAVMQEELKPVIIRLDKLEARFDNLETRFDNLETRFDNLETRFDRLEEDVSKIRAQQDENTGMINALLHNVQVANAKIDGLAISALSKDALANVATKEDISRLDAKIDILTVRQTNQEVSIKLLKQA